MRTKNFQLKFEPWLSMWLILNCCFGYLCIKHIQTVLMVNLYKKKALQININNSYYVVIIIN